MAISNLSILPSIIKNIDLGSIPIYNYFFITSYIFNINFANTFVIILMSVNLRIKSVFQLIDESSYSVSISKCRSIMKIYSNLLDIIKLSNKYFSLTAMVIFTEYTLHCVMMLLTFYDICMRGFPLENIIYFITGAYNQFATGSSIILLITTSEILKNNGQKVFLKIREQKILSKDKNVEKFLKILSLQSNHELITSCGLFKFDWKIIFNMLTASFSFFLVAVQFDMIVKN